MIGDELRLAYFASLLVLVMLIVWYFREHRRAEHLEVDSTGVPEQIYTSGASMRVIGQVFTATDEGNGDHRMYNELLNRRLRRGTSPQKKVSGLGNATGKTPAEVIARSGYREPNQISKPSRTEHLVNEHGFPDFWEINPTLNAFHDEMASI